MLAKLFTVAAAVTGIVAAGKPMEVSLEVPWNPVSDGVLALETISKYNASAFFPMLSVLLSERMKNKDVTPAQEAEILFEQSKKAHLLHSSADALARHELSMGSLLAAIESECAIFDSVATKETENCPVVVWTEGVYTCDQTDLFAMQTNDKPQEPVLYTTDRVIGDGYQWIVAYADFDHPEFPDWHQVLLEMALTSKISYVLRHRSPVGSANDISVQLAGYSVGVNLKRTDYLVVDDRQNESGEQLKLDLDANNKVPASKVPILGYQAARSVRDTTGGAKKKFEKLKDIVYNFPEHAPKLAAMVGDDQDEITAAMAEEKEKSVLGANGFNGLFIDGLLAKYTDMPSLLENIHEELNVIQLLSHYLPENTDIPKLFTSGLALDSADLEQDFETRQRYDLSGDHTTSAIGWINDIEKDAMYSTMEDDEEMMKVFRGPFVPLRRNIHSIVLTGDIEDRQTLKLLGVLLQQSGTQLPLQIGFVSASPVWNRVTQLGLESTQAFIIQLLRGTPISEAEKHAVMIHEEADFPVKKPLAEAREWLTRFGLESSSEPSIFVNGFLLRMETWREQALQIFENDADYIRALDNVVERTDSLREVLFSTGMKTRNKVLDPLDDAQYISWPLDSPIQAFHNDVVKTNESSPVHSVVFSSSFSTPEAFDIVDALLERSETHNDVVVLIRPLSGIHERLYASILDDSYNMFRFSRDLFRAAKGHQYEYKTAPRVFEAASPPQVPAEDLPSGDDFFIIDGRLISSEETNNEEHPMTIDVLNKLLYRESPRVLRLQQNVKNITGVGIAALTSLVQKRTTVTDEDIPDIRINDYPGNLRVSLVIDPATEKGQELLALTDFAVQANLNVDVFLSPDDVEKVPSRYLKPVFDRHEQAVFNNLCDDVLYTTELLEPPSWVTVASECKYDLDNVILSTVKEKELMAIYSLRALLIEGFAVGPRAAGLQLELITPNGTKIADTMIMANLGYFQFQAPRPGEYSVCLSETGFAFEQFGESSDCLTVNSNTFGEVKIRVNIVSDGSAPTKKYKKKKGNSMWSTISGLVGGSSSNWATSDNSPNTESEINIFTVASGHLYERFASIMMLSVMKHTKHIVKFWLIENFLSPKFKEFVPELAAELGFDYEFITYKWPTWLRQQSEKQREIWGYKMLFLDVLFPQSLSNVIFVDSDQIVRTDFQDLLNIDLQGAPYAFTPMGDDREEMEPYRFWKQGFWKKVLLDNGFDYHISALYRVDLDRLRETKVGDILRQQYQRLSADPGSLANLDQDLPNSLQGAVPIYSLSPDWLWCETWCSDESLQVARTIDLCNNPLTKEPKLDRARRQVPEWTEYDNTIAELAEKYAAARASVAKTVPVRSHEAVNRQHNDGHSSSIEEEEGHDEL